MAQARPRAGIIDCDVHPRPRQIWEFDLTTGRAICEPDRTRVRTYPVTVELAEPPAVETYPVTVEEECLVLHL